MGAIWRMQDEDNYEEFYIRPHLSGMPDANQYNPVYNGVAGWQLYFGKEYSAPVIYHNNTWTHVKIAVKRRSRTGKTSGTRHDNVMDGFEYI